MARNRRHVYFSLWGFLLLIFACVSSAAGQTCVPPPADLISWWPLDESAGSSAVADIIGKHAGTVQGDTVLGVAGKVATAASFNGVNAFIDISSVATAFDPTVGTIDAWVYRTFADDDPTLLARTPVAIGTADESNVIEVFYFAQLGQFRFHYRTGTLTNFVNTVVDVPPSSILRNQWVHIAFTWDKGANQLNGGEFKAYINGSQVGTTQNHLGNWAQTADTAVIGGNLGTPRQLGGGWQGAVDEVELYNRALSANEIAALFAAGGAGKCKPVPFASLDIDIKPGSFPNSINPKSKGVIPVTILTTKTFDATTVDPTTVLFGRTGTEAAPVHSTLEDVDGDGDTDMVLHFKTQNTGIRCGDTSASLTGETVNGQAIEGSDTIKTVGCK